MQETVLLIDNENLVHRAYFATFKKEERPRGFPINGIIAWATMLQSLLREFQPSKVVLALDNPSIFRKAIYPDYKAQRDPKPDDLKLQLAFIKRITRNIGLPFVEDQANEADDLIGSLCAQLRSKYICLIASTDKDFGQLIGPRVHQVKQDKDRLWQVLSAIDIVESLGVTPNMVSTYLALVGDSVDNIPGIDGIGEKTAPKLLEGSPSPNELVDRIMKAKRKLPENVVRAALALNLQLTNIREDIPVQVQRANPNPTIIDELNQIGAFSAVAILQRIMRAENFKANPLPHVCV